MVFQTNIKKDYTIVRTSEQLLDLKKHISDYHYIAFDIETTGLNVRKDKIIGFSVCGKEGQAFYLPHLEWNAQEQRLDQVWDFATCAGIVSRLKTKALLTWNGSFDLRTVYNFFNINLFDQLFCDGMLLQHTLNEEGPFALKECAKLFQYSLGLDVETAANAEQIALKENVAKNGGSITKGNFEMYKADLEVLGTYAAADADLTFRLCEVLNNKLYEEELDRFFYDEEVMPLYRLVTIPMEHHGIYVNTALLDKVSSEIKVAIAEHKKKVLEALYKEPEFHSWVLSQAEDYTPSNKGKFGAAVNDYYNLKLPKLVKKEIERLPESPAKTFLLTGRYAETPLHGFLDGIEHSIDVKKVQRYLYEKECPELININSKSQLADLVFNFMGVAPSTLTKKGAPQFNDDFIESIENQYSWAKVLSDYNKLVKIDSSYFQRIYDMLENGQVYFNFKQHGTISGRYSSDAQQFPRPKEEGELSPTVLYFNNVVRELFISGPGRSFIDDDYESLEPHVFSDVSGDARIQEIFHKMLDFYSTIAIRTEKLEQYSADKKAENYLGKLNKPKRQSAKAYSLGVPYGMTGYALAKTLGISPEEGEALVKAYLEAFPDLADWMHRSRDFVKAFGYIKTRSGRVRHLPKVPEIYRKYGDKLLDFRFRKSLEKSLGKEEVLNLYRDYKNGLNNCLNFQIQGLSSSIVNRAAIEITKRLKEASIDGWVALQVHDQIVVNVPEDDTAEAAILVQQAMENVYPLSVKLKAPAAVGKNLKEAH